MPGRAMPLPDWTLLLRTPAFEVTALLLGLVAGSFANVCIHRLPRERSVVSPPSRCPACDALIRPWDNVPVLSWLVLRGRCRACRAPISIRYPAVEATNGLLWLALAALRGPSLQTLVSMLVVSALLVLTLIDLEHMLLPNAVTRPGIVLGLVASALPGSPIRPLEAALAAAGGYLAFALVWWIWRRFRGLDALGQGDWKLAAMLGACLGWPKMLLTVFLACVIGAVVGIVVLRLRGTDRLPFGTFLGAAGILAVFAGDAIVAWYRGILGG
jgi:leader peptidase (prepilin peptidase)/N-methyltransferase